MRKFMLALSVLLTPVLMPFPAYASDGGFNDNRGESIGGGRDTIAALTKAMSDLVDVMGKVWNVMVSNPMLLVFLGAGLFSVGIWIFRKIRSAAKG